MYNIVQYIYIQIYIQVQLCHDRIECAKFGGSGAIVGLVNLVPPCHHVFVGILWVQNIFSWAFCGSKSFSCRYFVGLQFFLVGISWVQFFQIQL